MYKYASVIYFHMKEKSRKYDAKQLPKQHDKVRIIELLLENGVVVIVMSLNKAGTKHAYVG